jgi:Leucine-rich repeat (LRR) protein
MVWGAPQVRRYFVKEHIKLASGFSLFIAYFTFYALNQVGFWSGLSPVQIISLEIAIYLLIFSVLITLISAIKRPTGEQRKSEVQLTGEDISIRMYIAPRGSEPTIEKIVHVDCGIQELNLAVSPGGYITHIDLAQLKPLSNLKVLILGCNSLTKIDLSPLGVIDWLEEIHLHENKLPVINLDPLRYCENLKVLYLSYNQLAEIDLSPLSKCTKLEYLGLEGNEFESIDLSPLAECKNLRRLWLNESALSSLDITPLFSCLIFEHLQIDNIPLLTSVKPEMKEWPKGLREHRSRVKLGTLPELFDEIEA